jgi:alpha-ribazole phosphatase
MILHLVRHPRPQVAPGICYGRLDVAAESAAAALDRLRAGLPPGLPVWTSPLRRCLDLAVQLHPSPAVDARLAEMDFGAWEGRPWDEVPRAELDAWAADVAGYAPPGGESPRQLQERVLEFVAGLAVGEAVLVTHGGVIRVLEAHVTGRPIAANLARVAGYGTVTTLTFREGATSGDVR